MVALYVNSRIVCGFFPSWWGGPPQSFECSIWDCVGFYTIHTFLDPSVESQFRIISKTYNFLFGTTTTQSFTFSTSHFFSGQSWHATSSSILLYLWYGARVGGSKSNAVNLILRLFLYHILHTMSLWHHKSIHNSTNNQQSPPPWWWRHSPLQRRGFNESTLPEGRAALRIHFPRMLLKGLVKFIKLK